MSSFSTNNRMPAPEELGLEAIPEGVVDILATAKVSPTHRSGNLNESDTPVHRYGFFVIPERKKVPKPIVKHLKAMSQLPQFKARVGDDRFRFDSPRVGRVRRRFTKDEGGRRIYGALDMDTRMLAGLGWRHLLYDDGSGHDIVAAVRQHNLVSEERGAVSPDYLEMGQIATTAVRVHPLFQHTGLLTQLMIRGGEEYKAAHPSVTHEVMRIPDNDTLGPLIENPLLKERWAAKLLLGSEQLMASNVFYGVYDLNHGSAGTFPNSLQIVI